MRLLYL